MYIRPLVMTAALAIATIGAATYPNAAEARSHVNVSIRFAPPPPRAERVVVRPGYVWTPGYWNWNGRRHVWVAGQAVKARRGYAYVAPRWEHRGAAWNFRAGTWVRR